MPIVRASHLSLSHAEMGRSLEGENLMEPQHMLQDNMQSFRRCFQQVPRRVREGTRHTPGWMKSLSQAVSEGALFQGDKQTTGSAGIYCYRIASRANN